MIEVSIPFTRRSSEKVLEELADNDSSNSVLRAVDFYLSSRLYPESSSDELSAAVRFACSSAPPETVLITDFKLHRNPRSDSLNAEYTVEGKYLLP
jgi:hypothetical protein